MKRKVIQGGYSMDSKIIEWLQTYEPINEIAMVEETHSERLTDSRTNLTLQRIGFDEQDKKYITDSGWIRNYQYNLFLKSESEVDLQRLSNLDWLDEFSDWLAEQNKAKNFPELDDGKKVTNVSCANALTYQENDDGSISVYSLEITFEIKKEG